jgi:hypothetical protein
MSLCLMHNSTAGVACTVSYMYNPMLVSYSHNNLMGRRLCNVRRTSGAVPRITSSHTSPPSARHSATSLCGRRTSFWLEKSPLRSSHALNASTHRAEHIGSSLSPAAPRDSATSIGYRYSPAPGRHEDVTCARLRRILSAPDPFRAPFQRLCAAVWTCVAEDRMDHMRSHVSAFE